MKRNLLLIFIACAIFPNISKSQCGPIITCPANITTNATTGVCGANVTYTATAVNSCPTGTVALFTETFQSGGAGWTLNVNTGTNAAQPNQWEVNDSEGGVTPPGCGVATNGDLTLHITCTSLFCGSFITGAVYNATNTSNKRAESPSFSTVGSTGLALNFNFISLGSGLLDNASVLYNDGTGWQVLTASIKAATCGSGQGLWTAYSAVLPASCDNKPNVRIGFNWTNNNDNVGTDPSIAINNITVVGPSAGAAPTIAYSTPIGSLFPVGTTTVTATATDALMATASCTFSVTVADNQAPVISSCPSNININTTAGSCTGIANWTPPTANDNCPAGLTLTGSQTSGSAFPIGVSTVTYTANDGNGNNATCTFSVTVTDNQVPVISSCPGNITMVANSAACAGAATWFAPTATDNCPSLLTFTSSHNSGDTFPLGTTTVTYTANDGNGNTATCNFDVTVTSNLSSLITSSTASCSGTSTGTASVTPVGGTPAYTYTWSPMGGNGSSATGLSANNYTCQITDANGCVTTTTVNVNQPAVLTNTVQVTNTTCVETKDGAVDLTTGGGTGPYSYMWSVGSTTEDLINVFGGVYSYTVTDANFCVITGTVNVGSPAPIDTSVTVVGFTLTANNSNATYQWVLCKSSFIPVPGETNQTFTPLVNDNYAVILTENGCTDTSGCYGIYPTGISSITAQEIQLNIYPNPNNGTFTISSTSIGEFSIVNELGQSIQIIKLTTANNYTTQVRDLSKGFYYLMSSDRKTITRKKIVVVD